MIQIMSRMEKNPMKDKLCILVMNVFMCFKNRSMDYCLKYCIANGVLIVTFHVSTTNHVEGHHIQDEARKEDEHDVDPLGKYHHFSVIFINGLLAIIIKKTCKFYISLLL